jgi:hypothetical protein
MYVSYGIAVFFLIIFGVCLISFFKDIEILTTVSFLSILVVVLAPLNHFFSRLIWINIFVDYIDSN